MSDDIQAQLDELRAELEAKSARIGELSKENAKWRRQAQGKDSVDPEEHAKIVEELEALRNEYGKVTKTSKAEIEKLTAALNEKDGALQKYLIEGGLTEALANSGVRPELMKAAKAMLKSQTQIKADNGEYQALMGDAPLADAVAAWAASDEGKHFVSAPSNSGGGATGGNNGTNITPKGNLAGDKTQRTNAIAARFPELAKA